MTQPNPPPDREARAAVNDLRARIEQLQQLLPRLRAALPGQPTPCFGHLRLVQGGRARDVFLGYRTVVAAGLTVLDWQAAPLAEAFFSCQEGDDYEIEVEAAGDADGRTLTGTVAQRHVLSFDKGELCAIGSAAGWLVRGADGWQLTAQPALLLARGPEALQRPPSPVEVPLDAAQRAVVALPPGEPTLVLGEAGCGKTTVALHRLAALCRAADEAGRRARAAVLVPTEGLRRFVRDLLDRLGLPHAEAWQYDRWAAEQARRAFPDVPQRESQDATAGVIRLKRHPALRAVLGRIARRGPRTRRRDLLLLFGDQVLLEQVAATPGDAPPIPLGAQKETLLHTKVQFSKTTEEESRHIDAERLETLDARAIDEGTPMEDAGTIDVEDYAVLFELDRLRAQRAGGRKGGGPARGPDREARSAAVQDRGPALPRMYDCLVLDEAQEFAPLELALIGRAVASGGTLVVAGDDGQQVDPTAYFAGWPATMADLGASLHRQSVLEVSYRSPPEITRLARRLLGRGGAPLPDDVGTGATSRVTARRYDSEFHLVAALLDALRELRGRDRHASAAVICRTAATARRLWRRLSAGVDLHLALDGDLRFGGGCLMTSVEEVKGLEFDYVICPDVSAAAYPDTPESRRALYVAVTRPVHQLVLCSVGTPSPIWQ